MKKLRDKLRTDFYQKIRPLFVGQCCERCSANDNLHLHHASKKFVECAEEVSKFIKFDLNDDISSIDEDSLEFIRSAMLGKQLMLDYITLCNQCHLHEHLDDKKRQGNKRLLLALEESRKIRKQDEVNYVHTIVKDFMDANSYKEIPFQNRDIIRDIFKVKIISGKNKLFGMKSISNYMQNNGLKYTIVSKIHKYRINGEHAHHTCWIIKAIDDNGAIVEKEVEEYDMKDGYFNEK